MSCISLVSGFDDPVTESQSTFRCLMTAMSEPGSIIALMGQVNPDGLYPSTFAVCQTLLDAHTQLWLSPGLNTEAARRNLHFHTGVVLTENRDKSQFALAHGDELDSLEGFERGNSEYPELSCTLLLQVQQISRELSSSEATQTLRLTGPGIPSSRTVAIGGLHAAVVAALTDREDQFPLGMDIILLTEHAMLCIPRTTRVEAC